MSELLDILLNVLSPIFMVVGAAALIGWRWRPDIRAVSALLVYVFVPALSFKTLLQLEIDGITGLIGGPFGQAFVHITLLAVCANLMALGVARAFGLDRQTSAAFALSASQINAGNYGIPLCTFAFGSQGGAFALLFYVSSSIINNMAGIFIASSGSVNMRRALANVFSVPTTWGAVIALTMNLFNLSLPLNVERAVFLAADATLPVMLALLGLILGQMDVRTLNVPWRWVSAACGLRLIGGAMLGFIIAGALGFTGVFHAVAVLESSVPTAVLANALAAEFGADARFTSAATLISTLASLGTITILVAILR